MELKEQKPEALKAQLKKTKRIMQFLTFIMILILSVTIYDWISKKGDWDLISYSPAILVLSFLVVVLDKKSKKIKSELTSRDNT